MDARDIELGDLGGGSVDLVYDDVVAGGGGSVGGESGSSGGSTEYDNVYGANDTMIERNEGGICFFLVDFYNCDGLKMDGKCFSCKCGAGGEGVN